MRTTLLIAGGVLNCALVAFHVSFWRFKGLDWKHELPKTNPANRGAVQVMNVMLIYVFAAFAAVSFVMAAMRVPRAMLTAFAIVIGGFYAVRAALQPVFFKPSPVGNALMVVCVATAVCYFLALL